MIDGLKPYPEYKESGQPWLGTIPKHWEVVRNGRLFAQRNQTGFSELPILEVSLKTGVRVRNFDESKRKQVMTDRAKYKRANRGDIAYNMMRMWQGALGRVPVDGLVSPAYVVARPLEGSNTLYFSYLFRTAAYQQEVNNASRGIVSDRNRLYWVDFKQLPSVVPPPDEQAAIVRFLGHSKQRIDHAIRAKKKLIVLLNEQKQAIIHQAVTYGFATNIRLKPSCVPWLGSIPEHWEVLRAKYVFREVDERTTTGDEELLSVSHITGVTPRSEKNITMFKASSYIGHKLCRPGDLVINTMWAWMAALGVSNHEGIISPSYAVYRPCHPEKTVGPYFDYLLRMQPYIAIYICCSTGIRASRLRLYPEEFFKIRVLLPPVQEQHRCVERIALATAELNNAMSGIQSEIDLLREYRTRLISDVVTGKLDVREAARHLPDDAEEPITMEADNGDMESELELDDAIKEAEA